MSDPAELDGVVDATTSVEWRGLTLTLPASLDDCDIEVLEAMERGQAVNLVRSLVGPDQWNQIRAAGLSKVRELKELGEVIAKALGFAQLGE